MEKLYSELKKTTASGIIAFNSLTLDFISENKVGSNKKLHTISQELSSILWEWQNKKPTYLDIKKPVSKDDCLSFYSYKVYNYVKPLVDIAHDVPKKTTENTITGVLYDICLFSTWFMDGLERAYLDEKPNVFDSDIFDVKIDFLQDIINKSIKISDSYIAYIEPKINFLAHNHPNNKKGIMEKSINKTHFS